MISQRTFWVWFGGIWFGIGLPFLVLGLFLGFQQFTLDKRLDADGRTVDGMVLTKSYTRSSSQSSSAASPSYTYKVTFRFSAPGGTMTGESQMTEEAWDQLIEREPIRVTFLPEEPHRYRVAGQSSAWLLPVIFAVLGGFFAPGGAIILIVALRRLRVGTRLLREGVAATATVFELGQMNIRINRVPQWRARYRYQDEAGRHHTGQTILSPEDAMRWKEGDTVSVRYDRKRPEASVWVGNT